MSSQINFDFYTPMSVKVNFCFDKIPCSCGTVHTNERVTWIYDEIRWNRRKKTCMKCAKCGCLLMEQKTFL